MTASVCSSSHPTRAWPDSWKATTLCSSFDRILLFFALPEHTHTLTHRPHTDLPTAKRFTRLYLLWLSPLRTQSWRCGWTCGLLWLRAARLHYKCWRCRPLQTQSELAAFTVTICGMTSETLTTLLIVDQELMFIWVMETFPHWFYEIMCISAPLKPGVSSARRRE